MISNTTAARIIISGIIAGVLFLGNAMCVSFVESQQVIKPIGR
jgi:hypothetical protein